MRRPAVFLDRDGTINEQMGYINHPSRFKILPGVAEAIKRLNENQFLAIVVSNQSGVARGYFPIELVHVIHDMMRDDLKKKSAHIDGIFFCPHYPRGAVKEYTGECECRKPQAGLIDQACRSFDIDMSRSYVVGDRYTDIQLAQRCDLKGVMVKTGYGLGDVTYVLPYQNTVKPAYIAEDLLDAVKWILEREKGDNSL